MARVATPQRRDDASLALSQPALHRLGIFQRVRSNDPPTPLATRPDGLLTSWGMTTPASRPSADLMDELDSLKITEILDQDSRPTFVIDLDPDEEIATSARTVRPIFCNSALRLHEQLFGVITGENVADTARNESDKEEATYEDFSAWATGVTRFDDSRDVFPLSFLYSKLLWTGSTVRKRWRLISGNLLWNAHSPVRNLSAGPPREVSTGGVHVEQTSEKYTRNPLMHRKPSLAPTENSSITGVNTLNSSKQQSSKLSYFPKTPGTSSDDTRSSSDSKPSIILTTPEKAVADWTLPKPKGLLSAHLAFARTVHWDSTPLGPMEKWSPEFRQIANLCMANPHPAALFWGSDLTMLYNEAYAAEVAGNKHPSLMGTGFQGPFSELWDAVGPVFAECARTGISVRRENDYLPIERHGFLEETFYSWSFTPLYGGTKRILGFYNAPFETTQQVLSHRRMRTINKLGENTSRAGSVKQFWKLLLNSLEDNHFDVPFALLYSVADSEDADHSSASSESTMSLKCCYLEGSLGIPEGHIAAPQQLDLKRSREGFIPSFREAMRTREPTLLHTRDGTLPVELLDGINWRGFGDPCREAIIFPVRPTNGDMVLAFLLVGVNPRRPYDVGYKSFTSMLNRQMATSLASVMLLEEELRRSRDAAEAAALEQEHLTQQLAMQTSRLQRMTQISPLGMVLFSPEGVLQEANDRYFEMTGHPRESIYEMSWMEQIMESSRKSMEQGWHQMVVGHLPWSGELQMKKLTVHPVDLHGEDIEYWVLANAQPEFASDGSLRSIMGSITDISHLKWAQGLQNRRLQEAEETRRQQNEFIDITSHEMRNPLSAILQCADDILATLESNGTLPSQAAVQSCVEAANTIMLCVQHQKSIVDDILTISKLDSNLLVITPVPTQPIEVAKRAVKMFDSEFQAKDIQIAFRADASLHTLSVDWVALDPSRVLQILINLITNAIKFTADSDKRMITVSASASWDPPLTVAIPDFQYIPVRTPNIDPTIAEEWGTGEVLYLSFMVQDTGCGLTPEEKKVLFERFSQASPRTHAQYGGSGLGLFISRQLTELHGGQIGVSSEASYGSTFGFFIRARKSVAPIDIMTEQSQVINQNMSAEASVGQRTATPQRQGLATTASAAADLVAVKAKPKFDPRDLKILVVEDNIVNQKILVKQLKKVGCEVSVANDGIEALAFIEETQYRKIGGRRLSVILMDLEMPNMNGLTCVREIRKMEEDGMIDKHLPVIAVTANLRDEQVVAAKRTGMDDVMPKPFRIPDLMKKIELVLMAQGGNMGFARR